MPVAQGPVDVTGEVLSIVGGGVNGAVRCADTQSKATGSSARHTSKLCPPCRRDSTVTENGARAALAENGGGPAPGTPLADRPPVDPVELVRMIATAQEQFRAQNPYYQAPPAPGEIRDEAFEGEDNDEGGQPGQGQPAQGQPAQGQPNFGSQQNYNNNQQPPYPPREQPQPYSGGGQQPNSNYQGRPQHQPQHNQPQQNPPYSPPPQQYQPPAAQPATADVSGLPSFITGTQPQPSVSDFPPNGHDNNQGGDRFPRHRRRRHRGPGGPSGPGGPNARPDLPNTPQDFRGDDGPDIGNS